MIDDLVIRLEGLGYKYVSEDLDSIEYCLQSAEAHITNSCNLKFVPEGLKFVAVDIACGEFLNAKREAGQLGEFNAGAAIKTIKEGDTYVTYENGAGMNSFDMLINHLINGREDELATYRVLKW